jgi:guanylate kinase
MLEWAEVFGSDFYGTPRSEVEPYQAVGIGVVLVIDVQGAAQVRAAFPGCVSIFIAPPSVSVLEERLRGRKDTSEERVRKRLETARIEMQRAEEFDHVIINDELDRAVSEFERVLKSRFPERC